MMLKVIQSLQVISFNSRVLLLNKSRVSRETCDTGRLWLAAWDQSTYYFRVGRNFREDLV